MRLKPDEIRKLSVHAGNLILNRSDIQLKVPRPKILETIEAVLAHHFEEERQIDTKAEQLYLEQAAGMGKHERGKAIAMIRKQLAKEKDFVLSGAMDARFSADKISHLAHLIGDRLYDDDLMDFKDEDDGPKVIKKILMDYFQRENEIADKIRKKIQSMSNAPFEGSRDWDALYRRFFEEEMKRLGHS